MSSSPTPFHWIPDHARSSLASRPRDVAAASPSAAAARTSRAARRRRPRSLRWSRSPPTSKVRPVRAVRRRGGNRRAAARRGLQRGALLAVGIARDARGPGDMAAHDHPRLAPRAASRRASGAVRAGRRGPAGAGRDPVRATEHRRGRLKRRGIPGHGRLQAPRISPGLPGRAARYRRLAGPGRAPRGLQPCLSDAASHPPRTARA